MIFQSNIIFILSTLSINAKIFQDSANQKNYIIEHLYISPITMQLKLLANTNGFNNNLIGEVSDYCSFVRCMYDYACRGAFEKNAEFRFVSYKNLCKKIDVKKIS